jgi:subtilisin family serine protease
MPNNITVNVHFGGRRARPYKLTTNDDMVVVRTMRRSTLGAAGLSSQTRVMLDDFQVHTRFREAGVEVLQSKPGAGGDSDAARRLLTAERDVRFAGRALSQPKQARMPPEARDPIVYSENLFVKFDPSLSGRAVQSLFSRYKLRVKEVVDYAPNGYFVAAPEGIGLEVFSLAERLLFDESDVELCHPELLRFRAFKAAAPQQWHLQRARVGGRAVNAHASVTAAWRLTEGEGVTIAVIDDGFDVDHRELKRAGKLVAPRDVTQQSSDPRPGFENNHGTPCAGIACAAGVNGASGVAPRAKLMPIRLASPLGSQAEAAAFAWAADHGADVISCSWGPRDGRWFDPNDPLHQAIAPLPDNTRLAIDYAVTKGRGGKGCVVLFAAGNGNESVQNDGYASYKNVIAVAACNDRGVRSVYSDFGKAIWCAFPSSDFEDQAAGRPAPLTPGVWTTDRSGNAGRNPGGRNAPGDEAGDYTATFGGTSAATPGVAGTVGLMLAVNPSLTVADVRRLLKETCDRIDAAEGAYNANGHSTKYGFGRVNVLKAVRAAQAAPGARARKRVAKKK